MKYFNKIVAVWAWIRAAGILLFGDYKELGIPTVLGAVAICALIGYGFWKLSNWEF